jgi:hypothetical protein
MGTGEIITTKKSIHGSVSGIKTARRRGDSLQDQKQAVAIATLLARVASGVSSIGSRKGMPQKPMAKNPLKT